VSATELATLLAATTSMPATVPDSTFAPVPYPIVFDVDGLPPGAYRYDGGEHVLAPIREVARESVAAAALLQREHGTGAALLFLVVPLSRWLTVFGDRGYRGAAFSAGWLTDRLYLVAETLDLTYTATGGFAPGVVDELLGLDGCERTAFFAFAVGGKRASAARENRSRM
jgi:SagB-type dehydrogenase family enzyme